MEAAHHGSLIGGAIAILHPACPNAAGGSEFADLFKKVNVGVEEEAQAAAKLVDVLPLG
jgi:hypothetical protein